MATTKSNAFVLRVAIPRPLYLTPALVPTCSLNEPPKIMNNSSSSGGPLKVAPALLIKHATLKSYSHQL